jgi:hypothetical protein
MKRLQNVLGTISVVTLALPGVALAAPRTFQELINYVVLLLNSATAVLIVFGLVVYFYGIATNILKMGERDKVKAYFFWGDHRALCNGLDLGHRPDSSGDTLRLGGFI